MGPRAAMGKAREGGVFIFIQSMILAGPAPCASRNGRADVGALPPGAVKPPAGLLDRTYLSEHILVIVFFIFTHTQ